MLSSDRIESVRKVCNIFSFVSSSSSSSTVFLALNVKLEVICRAVAAAFSQSCLHHISRCPRANYVIWTLCVCIDGVDMRAQTLKINRSTLCMCVSTNDCVAQRSTSILSMELCSFWLFIKCFVFVFVVCPNSANSYLSSCIRFPFEQKSLYSTACPLCEHTLREKRSIPFAENLLPIFLVKHFCGATISIGHFYTSNRDGFDRITMSIHCVEKRNIFFTKTENTECAVISLLR